MVYAKEVQGKRRKLVFLLLIVGVILLAGLSGFLIISKRPSHLSAFSYNNELDFSYPRELLQKDLSDADKEDGFIFRATEKPSTPPFLVTIRREKGLEAVSALTKQQPIDLLVANTKRAYPGRFPGYQELQQRQFEHNGHKAAEFIFTYQQAEGKRIKQRFWIIMKNSDTAFYVNAQAKEDDFTLLDTRYFSPLLSSIQIK